MNPVIAVDAMGGDHAPGCVVDGCVQAAREYGLPLLLVGRRQEVEAELGRHDTRGLSIELVHASETVGMGESPTTALRRKKDSSIRVGAELVRNGKAQAFVSAGNTGAVMTTAKVVVGALEGVARPALTAIVPNLRGRSVWLDVGANVDCRPDHLVQFALMGHLYAREVLGISRPRVGLLSIGEEDGKGNEQTREAFKVLKSIDINFQGNCEGRDIFNANMDVIICDGFIGNVSLKAIESVVEAVEAFLREEISKSLPARLGFLLSRNAFRNFKKRVDYAEYGGVPLLGIKGCVIIGHGHSSAKAIKSAVRVARDFTVHKVNDRIHEAIIELSKNQQRLAV
ncbi:MAG: phosphate acyltransferase PlsX [Acidobacteria bacterium]|nr:phosphate acyltransferase PlsX [Acidobacteriota bacterium]